MHAQSPVRSQGIEAKRIGSGTFSSLERSCLSAEVMEHVREDGGE
jgi:hypothetical protein